MLKQLDGCFSQVEVVKIRNISPDKSKPSFAYCLGSPELADRYSADSPTSHPAQAAGGYNQNRDETPDLLKIMKIPRKFILLSQTGYCFPSLPLFLNQQVFPLLLETVRDSQPQQHPDISVLAVQLVMVEMGWRRILGGTGPGEGDVWRFVL